MNFQFFLKTLLPGPYWVVYSALPNFQLLDNSFVLVEVFWAKILQQPPQIFPACLLMYVTFVLLSSFSFLRSVLRLMIFHNLKNILLVDLLCTYRERQRIQEVWFDFHMQNQRHLCYEIPNF